MGLAFILLLLFGIGFVCGLRSMTAPAVVCWGAHLGWFQLAGSPSGFFAHPASLIIFTIFAFGELVADKLPFIPRRTMLGPLLVRLVFGAVCGAALCVARELALPYGVLLGALGAVIGAYAGFHYRRLIPASSRSTQFFAALLEDVVAVGGGLLIVSRF
jgi:uncharacterized membrane protein